MYMDKVGRLVLFPLLGFCVLTCASSSADDQQIKGSGKPASQKRKLQPFRITKLNLPASLTVSQSQAASPSCDLECDDNLLPHIESNVKDGVLTISSQKTLIIHSKLAINITTQKLDELYLNGASNSKVGGISGEKFLLSTNGSTTADLKGKCKKLKAEMNGAGTLKAQELETEDTVISITGSGTAELNATKSLNASISGAGNIRYKGNPTVTRKIMGVGNIRKI